jgi:imidazolonepropionase-like amidohydrolase
LIYSRVQKELAPLKGEENAEQQPQAPPELAVINGQFHTMDPARPQATAVAIDDERIVAVGEASSLRERFPAKEVLDLGGRRAIPGLEPRARANR